MNARTSALHASAEGPQTFVRPLTVPPGFPWEQRRAAELEARMGAPGGGAGLQIKVARTAPWRPDAPGVFVSVYLRAPSPIERFDAEITTADGKQIRVPFRSAEAARQDLLERALRLGVVALPLALAAAAILASVMVRAEREQRLEAIEARAERALRLTRTLKAASVDAETLRRAGADGRRIENALADLNWLGAAKTPEAHVQSVHWENGLMALQVRGPAVPVRSDGRELRRASAPQGPGLYLWGVGPAPGRGSP